MFSYGLDHSPAFRAFLARGGPELTLAGLYLHRQMLGPYTNMLDGIPAPEATDLTAFSPRPRELEPALYEPRAVDQLLPWLRNAAVTRVLSLDPLTHADLVPLGTVAPGPPALAHPPLRGRVCVAAHARRLPGDRGGRSRAGPAPALFPRIRPGTRRGPRGGARVGRGRSAGRDLHAGPGPAHGGAGRGGALRRRDERQRLPRRPRQLCQRLAGAGRRGGRPRPARQRQAPGGARPGGEARRRDAVRASGPVDRHRHHPPRRPHVRCGVGPRRSPRRGES